MIYGNAVGGLGIERTYVLTDEAGNEYPATYVDYEMSFDATENDIRIGKYAATDEGIVRGTKEIPAYHTSEGYKAIANGKPFVLPMADGLHEYTKLQAIICPYNTSIANSVSAEKVVIEGNVYAVQSTVSEAVVTTTDDPTTIDFGITNTFGKPCLLRYFTYKEID